MKRIATLLASLALTISAMGQGTMDFAQKFMEQCEGDTAVHCVTVSPKMMEQIAQGGTDGRDANLMQAIEKLKSARIVTVSTHGEGYYQVAEGLLKKNARRFAAGKTYHTGHAHGAFYTRKGTEGETVELVMLHADTERRKLVIVNLTGDIDRDFIDNLTRSFAGKTAKAQTKRKDNSMLSL